MKRIAITGANGFIGKPLADFLERNGYCVTRIIRREESFSVNSPKNPVVICDLTKDTNWNSTLEGMDTLIHLAARVHVMRDTLDDPLTEFRQVNTNTTLNLAHQAAKAGISRFIYLSSIKVNGEETNLGHPFSENDQPAPQDAYAISKLEAEQGLYEIAKTHELDVVIIRPPLVYGPGVKGNFLRMMQWVILGAPLPFHSIQNKRSLLGLDNLLDFIGTCIEHSAAANEVFLVSDGVDLSTPGLLHCVGDALGKPVRLFSVPQKLLEISLQIMQKRNLSQRLLGSLQINLNKANKMLGWIPPYHIEEGLKKTAQEFLRSKHR